MDNKRQQVQITLLIPPGKLENLGFLGNGRIVLDNIRGQIERLGSRLQLKELLLDNQEIFDVFLDLGRLSGVVGAFETGKVISFDLQILLIRRLIRLIFFQKVVQQLPIVGL